MWKSRDAASQPDSTKLTMQASDAAIARIEEGQDYFNYYGREGGIIPRNVRYVKIHSSVRAIKDGTMYKRIYCLAIVNLNDGLEQIGSHAFP
jgi:hypothetical protein